MRFPWSKPKPETRAGGNFSDAVIHQIEAQAARKATGVGTTAAVEAAAGALSRAFVGAEVIGADWAIEAVTPTFLALVGRNLIRSGASMHAIEIDPSGRVELLPVSFWNFENSGNSPNPASPSSWMVRTTSYGPSSSDTRLLSWDGIVFATWGTSPGTPYVGTGPLGWASTTARTMAETERSLADEAGGPLAQIIPVPQDPPDSDDEADDPLDPLRSDISAARGDAVLVETTAAGWDEGQTKAPQTDWRAHRLGPDMPEAMVNLQAQAFEHVLAACGSASALFTDADGTSQREALRRWHMGTVRPLARMLAHELTAKLETPVRFKFDGYPLDLQARASTFKALVAGGADVNNALAISGLLADDL